MKLYKPRLPHYSALFVLINVLVFNAKYSAKIERAHVFILLYLSYLTLSVWLLSMVHADLEKNVKMSEILSQVMLTKYTTGTRIGLYL